MSYRDTSTSVASAGVRRRPRVLRLFMHAFFDETGDFRSDRISWFVGFAADSNGWNAFVPEWGMLLKKHRLDALHVTDFLSPHAPRYAALNLTDDRKREILAEFATIALKHAFWGFQIGINAAHYKEALPNVQQVIKADSFAFLRVIRLLHEGVLAAEDDMLECYFDERDDAKRFMTSWKILKAKGAARRKAFASIAFADDELITPLQAADLLGAAARRSHLRDDKVAALFDVPDDPALGKRVLRETWDADAFASHPDIRRIKDNLDEAIASGEQPS